MPACARPRVRAGRPLDVSWPLLRSVTPTLYPTNSLANYIDAEIHVYVFSNKKQTTQINVTISELPTGVTGLRSFYFISELASTTILQVWSYALSGFFRKFAVTSFFSIVFSFIIESASLSQDKAAQGNTALGCTAIVGAVIVSATHRHKHSRLIPHAATSVGCGIVMYTITFSSDQVRTC